MQSGLQSVIVGRLSRDAFYTPQIRNNAPTGREIVYLSVATDLKGYTDTQSNEFRKTTEFYTVSFTVPNGWLDNWKKKNLGAKGHMVMISGVVLLQRAKMYENQPQPNNVWVADDNNNIFNSVSFLATPHAIKDNGTNMQPEDANQQQQAQHQEYQKAQQTGNVPMQPSPADLPDDDIPF